jgi:hypothetical protein
MVPSEVTPLDLIKHIAEKHKLEAPKEYSIGDLIKLHRRLHENNNKAKTTKKALV